MKKTITLKWPLFILAVFLTFTSYSQGKVKFGEVSMEDLQMKIYSADSSAHAVILYDRGDLDGGTGRFTRHVRIKIISAAGAGYANFQVRTPSKSDIAGSTYNLVNDKIVETPLENDNIFKEEIVDGFSFYKIFFPAVRPGCVVELRYVFMGLPGEWRFQERIPVRYNELVLGFSEYIQFKKTMFGTSHAGRIIESNNGTKWVAENVPAFTEEPYMNHYANYLNRFRFDIEKIKWATSFDYYFDISSTWQKIGERMMQLENFGGLIRASAFLNEKAREIKKSDVPLLEKIKTSFDYIQENIKWNGVISEVASPSWGTNFKKNHSGNSAEVNLLLIALLDRAGINVYPAVLSTRDNGLLNPASASISSLNYVLAYVNMDGVELLIDATEPDITPGFLPTRCRNIYAYVINARGGGFPDGGWWADTSLGKSNTRKQFIAIRSEPDGRFVADVSHVHEDYDYMNWLEDYKKYDSDDAYIRSVIAKTTDLTVENCNVSIDKSKMKATEKRTVDLTNTDYVHDLGSELVINPFIFTDITNPFKQETRKYPIDFIFPKSRNITITFKVPDNYILRKQFDPLILKPEKGGANFSFLSTYMNKTLVIKCSLQIERQIFTAEEYKSLRHFFIEVNRKISEAIQLDKKT